MLGSDYYYGGDAVINVLKRGEINQTHLMCLCLVFNGN